MKVANNQNMTEAILTYVWTQNKEREKWIKLVYLKFLSDHYSDNGAKKKDLDGPRKSEDD